MTTLEACPCCGGPGKIKDALGRQVWQGWVGCPECGLYINWKISPDGAVRKWNRRTEGCFTVAEALDAFETVYAVVPEERQELAAALEARAADRGFTAALREGASPSPTGKTEAVP